MLALKIALRYLLARKSHKAVNIIALIALGGIAIATMAMMLVLSVFNGFSDLASSQLSEYDAPLLVKAAHGAAIPDGETLALEISRVPGIASALPVVTGRAVLAYDGRQIPVIFKGVPEGYAEVTSVDNIMIDGVAAERTTDDRPAIQVAVGVANALEAVPDPELSLWMYVPRKRGRVNPANPAASFRGAEVAYSGVFAVKNADIDADNIIVPIATARDVLAYDTEATGIEVRPDASTPIEEVKKRILNNLGGDYKVQTRVEQRAETFRMIAVEKYVTLMMLAFILVIALFNVISTLSLMAIEKRDNMSVLRALGAPQSLINRIFVAEGFVITIAGGLFGIVIGVILGLAQQYLHIVGLTADGAALNIDYYPVRVSMPDVALVALLVAITAVIAGVIGRIITRK